MSSLDSSRCLLTMSDYAIEVNGVSKMYRLFRSRRYEVMSLLGLPVPASSHDAFWALRDIDLRVPTGAKIGIIGHNGAGKSTLLKIIAGQVTPTAGSVSITGKVEALMELGTGFHPEFTGRENVIASLSYRGIFGKDANRRLEEIVDFSELDDFIDQSIKTYSAGMYARLAFSVATAIDPEILIIDEVLGAGDAYFAAKCVDRMKAITDSGATVLFVSHDLASVQRLCDRSIWINHGRLIADGDTLDVSKRYMQDVRLREERRLRNANLRLMKGATEAELMVDAKRLLVVHFIESEWRRPKGRLAVSSVSLRCKDDLLAQVAVGEAMDNNAGAENHVIVQRGFIDWSEPEYLNGRFCRRFVDVGGRYQHAAVQLAIDEALMHSAVADIDLCIEYRDCTEAVHVEIFDGNEYVRVGTIAPLQPDGWKLAAFPALPALARGEEVQANYQSQLVAGEVGAKIAAGVGELDVHGDKRALIDRVIFVDAAGIERHIFDVGEPMAMHIDYRILTPLPRLVVAFGIYTADGVTALQDVLHIDCAMNAPGGYRATWDFDPSPFGARDYVVSAALYPEFDFRKVPDERTSYCLWDRRTRFRVEKPVGVVIDMGLIALKSGASVARI